VYISFFYAFNGNFLSKFLCLTAYPFYTVHPVPTPPSTKADINNKINDGINNQKLILFKRGNAISGAPINKGTIQFIRKNTNRTIS